MHDRQHALEREAAGRRHHVLLRDAALEKALGQLRLERLDAAVRQEIRIEDDDLLAIARHLQQLVAVRDDQPLGMRRHDARRQRRIGERERRKAQRSEPFVHARDQLARGRDVVLQRRRAGVEVVGLIAAGDAFHERHAAPFDRVGDDDLRPIADRAELSECLRQRAQIVAVEPPDFPTEGAELVFDRSEIAHRGDRGVRLVSVVVDNDRDLAEPVVGDRLQRFPDLPFLQLAVAGHDDDAAAAAGGAPRARHAVRLRDAHPERSGIGRDERRLDVRMAGQSAEAAETVKEIEIQLVEGDEQRVQRGRVVPFG